jgi:hypothetical protein
MPTDAYARKQSAASAQTSRHRQHPRDQASPRHMAPIPNPPSGATRYRAAWTTSLNTFLDGFGVSDQERASDDLARDISEPPVVVAGILPQGRERVVHACLVPFREDSLRLFKNELQLVDLAHDPITGAYQFLVPDGSHQCDRRSIYGQLCHTGATNPKRRFVTPLYEDRGQGSRQRITIIHLKCAYQQ